MAGCRGYALSFIGTDNRAGVRLGLDHLWPLGSSSNSASGVMTLNHGSLLHANFNGGSTTPVSTGAVDLPFVFIFHRGDKWENLGDETRQEWLMTAADGASMIDVMGICTIRRRWK